jgi:hypothetical protein
MPRLYLAWIPNATELPKAIYTAYIEKQPLDVCVYCQDLWECRDTRKLEHPAYESTLTQCVICKQTLTRIDN